MYFLSHVALVLFPQVMQQQTLLKLGIWMAIQWPVMSEMFIPKTVKKISLFFSELLSLMSWMVFGVFCSFLRWFYVF